MPHKVLGLMQDGDTVLNLRACKINRKGVSPHSETLRAEGAEVTDYDFPWSRTEGVHNPQALDNQYDTVMASNVMNVQSSPDVMSPQHRGGESEAERW